MMPKAQPAIDAAGGQNITTWVTQAVGTAVRAGPPAALAHSAAAAAAPAATVAAAVAPPVSAPAPAAPALIPAPAGAPARAPAAPPSGSATTAHSSTWQANLARLERLAEVLSHHGLRARLMTPPGRVPSLHVVNPSAAALAEDVYAGRGQDGRWWFWWSWAERITVGEDLEGAASMIEHVLAASG